MKQLLWISIVLIITSCTTEKKCSRKFPPQTMVITKDSIIRTTETIYNDTVIFVYIKGDTVMDSILIVEGTTIKPSILITQFAYSKAWVDFGRLKHYLRQNDTTYRIQLNNAIRLTWERAERYYNTKEVQVKTERYIPKWVWWCLGISIIAIAGWIIKIIAIIKP